MVRIGLVGLGFMGMIHYLAYQKIKGARVTAICTRDPKRRGGDWRGIQGNFGPPGEVMELAGIAAYAELEEVLNDPNVDLVDLCLPPDLHASATIAALEAGKHVLVEKPMALRTADADRMLAAAARTGKRLLVAQVLPFFPEYREAHRIITSGQYGKLLGGIVSRIISNPTWLKDFFEADKVGGPVVDLHIHDAHFLQILCGLPQAVLASGRMRGDVVEFMTSQWRYPAGGPTLTAITGVIEQQGRPFTHGFELHLERATLLYSFAVLPGVVDGNGIPFSVLTPDGTVERPALGAGDPVEAFVAELSEAVEALSQGRPSPFLEGQLARDALLVCQRQTESVLSGEVTRV